MFSDRQEPRRLTPGQQGSKRGLAGGKAESPGKFVFQNSRLIFTTQLHSHRFLWGKREGGEMCVCVLTFYFYLLFRRFSFREGEGREKERERHWCERKTSAGCLWYAPWLGTQPTTQACTDRGSNLWPFPLRDNAQPTEPHWTGLFACF